MGMRHIKLGDFNNQYPQSDTDGGLSTSISLLGSGQIIYKGKSILNPYTKESSIRNNITYTPPNPVNINYSERVNFRFIIEFNNGEQWTSKSFYDDLLSAFNDSNPFFNKETVPIVPLNLDDIIAHSSIDKFKTPEAYSQSQVTDTINSIEDILLHIDWLVSQEPTELRPTKKSPNSDNAIGDWIITSTRDGTFGMEFSEENKKKV